jgi:hypothetical protein
MLYLLPLALEMTIGASQGYRKRAWLNLALSLAARLGGS